MNPHIIGNGSGPVVFCLCAQDEQEWLGRIAESLSNTENGILFPWPVADWNRDLTPWPAPAAFGREDFGGRGADTLRALEAAVQDAFPGRPVYLAGYSLGGLFSLWAFLESETFSGCASCSGSLWYPGWESYGAEKALRPGSLVYLSLGTHEERTRNPVMCHVGDATRSMAAALAEQGIRHTLEWNPGGHFKDVPARLEKGIRWIFENANVAL